MNIDKEIEKEKLKQKLLLESNILAWGKYYFPEKFPCSFCKELHGYFVDIRKDPFTSTLAPREHAKTTIKCFLIPIYQALVEPDEFKHYLNVQSTASKAISINISIKQELETNEKLIRDYGNQVGDAKWTEKQFVLKNGVIFSAVGAGESLRGLNYRNLRPDYIIADDLYDEDDIHNLNRITKKNNWFWSTLYPARSTSKKYCIHVQGTAINKQDLMHSTANNPNFIFRKFQAIKNWDTKEVLWKENPACSFENLLIDKENMGSIIFEREKQNNCRDDDSAIIKEAWIRYYNGTIPGDEKIIKRIGGLDPAAGQNALNDFSAYAYVTRTNLENFYIQEIKNEKLTFNEIIQTADNFHKRWNFQTFRVEAITAFKFICQELRRLTGVPVKEINSVPDKIARLEAQSSKFENGKVFINENIPLKLRNELIEQLINNNPNHDDIRDAVIICLEDQAAASGTIITGKAQTVSNRTKGF